MGENTRRPEHTRRAAKKKKKKRTMLKVLISFVIVLFLAGAGAFMYYNSVIGKPLKTSEDTITIEINDGEGFYDVLNKLESEGKLSNRLCIRVYLKINKPDISMHKGTYEIKTDVNMDEFISQLKDEKNNIGTVKIVVPEGSNIEKIADILEENELAEKEEFLNAVKNYKLPSYITPSDSVRYNLEGYLYPDTYSFHKDATPEEIVKEMNDKFTKVIEELKNDGVTISDEDMGRIITIASMIESEAKDDNDRPLISSVIQNRLNIDMKLQIDATVQYAVNEHLEKVYNTHLETDSPYNTYMYTGLPAGPICSPGIESIKAAVNPAETDYLFYLVQPDGSHYFTNSDVDFAEKREEWGYNN